MKRKSNIELLRIFAMLIITFNHVHSMTGVEDVVNSMNHLSLNALLSLFFFQGGKVGSNLFILGGGIFLIEQKDFRLRNALRIWLITFFYSVLLNVVDVTLFHQRYSIKEWVKTCLPITGGYYWFSRSYILLIFLLPVIRSFMKHCKWRNVGVALWTCILLISTIMLNGSIIGNRWIRLFCTVIGKGPFIFAYLVTMLMYLKEKGVLQKLTSRTGLLIAISSWILMWLVEIVLLRTGINTNNQFLVDNFSKIRDLPSMLCIVCAFGFFIWFYKMKIRENRVINSIAALVFGVYLVQCHSRIIWEGLFDFPNAIKASTLWYLLMTMSAVALFFAIGMGVEFVRQKGFEDAEVWLLQSKAAINIESMIRRFYARVNSTMWRIMKLRI